jgi:hypothetical protein
MRVKARVCRHVYVYACVCGCVRVLGMREYLASVVCIFHVCVFLLQVVVVFSAVASCAYGVVLIFVVHGYVE